MHKQDSSSNQPTVPALTRKDIILYEGQIIKALAGFFPVKSYNILFPKSAGSPQASWLAEESKLLLPIRTEANEVLAVLVVKVADNKVGESFVALWAGLNQLVVKNLLLYKQSLCDAGTGLLARHILLANMTKEIDLLRLPLEPSVEEQGFAGEGKELGRRSHFGLLVIRFNNMRRIVREFGYAFADELLVKLAQCVQENTPEEATPARTGEGELALFFPMAGKRQCEALAVTLLEKLKDLRFVHPVGHEKVSIFSSIGYVNFPYDMDGCFFRQPAYEQAQVLLRKARLAAALAADETTLNSVAIMGFGDILSSGGRVQEVLPYSKILLDIGSNMRVREGLVFAVWGKAASLSAGEPFESVYKGEVLVTEVGGNHSVAEILHLAGATLDICASDRLLLVPEGSTAQVSTLSLPYSAEAVPNLLGHGDFFAKFAKERERHSSFTLALVEIAFKQDPSVPDVPSERSGDFIADTGGEVARRAIQEGIALCRATFGQDILAGRYGLHSLIFFHAHQQNEELLARYRNLAQTLTQDLNLDLTVGLATYPYLNFRKADALDNCRKALEYAKLLPAPKVGLLDSLALNISADKLFSQDDTFGAIKEYQLALMADERNGMAWNSLGICLASLGRHSEAERHFLQALSCNADDSMALYNLGFVLQAQGHEKEAEEYYSSCLAKNADHLFALIRLGQLAENNGDLQQARAWYDKVKALALGQGIVYRHLARLCLKEGNTAEAREHLHEALIADPHDAFALQLLAKVFLDAGEDPDLAASFARKSVALRPSFKAGWLELARALEMLGQEEHARAANLRAAEL